MGIIEYNKPLDGPQLFFHHYRVDSRHLLINMQRIALLRQRHERRTQAMTHFLQQSQTCRTRILLAYFDEALPQNCGHCDVCLAQNKPTAGVASLHQEVLNIMRQKGTIPVQQVTQSFPAAIREDIVALIRSMADDKIIRLHPDGTLSVI